MTDNDIQHFTRLINVYDSFEYILNEHKQGVLNKIASLQIEDNDSYVKQQSYCDSIRAIDGIKNSLEAFILNNLAEIEDMHPEDITGSIELFKEAVENSPKFNQ